MEQKTPREFQELVRAKRLLRSKTQDALAAEASTTRSTIAQIERGERKPSASLTVRIANSLSLDADELCLMIGQMPPDVGDWLMQEAKNVRQTRLLMQPIQF